MLDYLEVKEFYARKLADDAAGTGRIESAFFHTMQMVYLQGVADGERIPYYSDHQRDEIIGIKN